MDGDDLAQTSAEDAWTLAQAIAAHAWENHAGDFLLLYPPVESEDDLADLVATIFEREPPRPAPRGRTVYFDPLTGTVVVVNPADTVHHGTAFRPPSPEDYVARIVGDIQ